MSLSPHTGMKRILGRGMGIFSERKCHQSIPTIHIDPSPVDKCGKTPRQALVLRATEA